MDAKQFLAEFGHIANAPGGVVQLRALIFALASSGQLLQNSQDVALKSLDKVTDFVMGQAPPGNECNTNGKGTVFIKTGEFGELYPTVREWTTKPLKLAKKGDVLICVVGATVGKLNLAIDCAIGRSVAAIRPRDGLSTKYLYYTLMPFTLRLRSGSRGSAQGVIGKSELSSVMLRVPDEEEQSRIVAKVDELMALCDKLETQQKQRRSLQNNLRQSILQAVAASTSPEELQTNWMRLADNFGQLFHTPNDLLELRQCVKQLALRGFLTNRDVGEEISPDLKNSASTSSHPVIEAHMDWETPSQWIWARTGWLGEARLGKMLDASKNKGEPLPYLRNINVRWRKFQLTDVLTMRVEPHELPKISVRQGDLVICEGGEPGRAAIWREPRDFVIQKALHRFRCGNDVLPEYMLLCLEHDYFSGRLSRYYTGATIKHLTGRSLSEYAIPLPPIAEQDRIVKRVDELILQCDQLERQLGSALQIADRLAISAIASITGITTESEEDEPMKAPKTELIAPLRLGTPPSTKEQAPLAAILAHQNGEMAAKDLWQRFGGEIDAFYAQLKLEVDKGWIQEPEMANMRQLETA